MKTSKRVFLLSCAFPAFMFLAATRKNKTAGNYLGAADTCFYQIIVPPDMDKNNLHFDTTIVRNTACRTHILRLPPQGTATTYILYPADTSGKSAFKKLQSDFHMGQTGTMDISKLPNGVYTMHLMACGNGGFFVVRLK